MRNTGHTAWAVLRAADLAANCLRGALPDGQSVEVSCPRVKTLLTTSRLASGLLGTGHCLFKVMNLDVGVEANKVSEWKVRLYTGASRDHVQPRPQNQQSKFSTATCRCYISKWLILALYLHLPPPQHNVIAHFTNTFLLTQHNVWPWKGWQGEREKWRLSCVQSDAS